MKRMLSEGAIAAAQTEIVQEPAGNKVQKAAARDFCSSSVLAVVLSINCASVTKQLNNLLALPSNWKTFTLQE